MNDEHSTNDGAARAKHSCGAVPPLHSPAFVVGVTGNMDPLAMGVDGRDLHEELRDSVRRVFRFLRGGKDAVRELRSSLAHEGFGKGFEDWKGLEDSTPVIVLSSLAPGADSMVADVALEPEFTNGKFHVQAPLPFPPEVYKDASTFKSENGGAGHFEELLGKIAKRNPDAAYTVLLKDDLELSAEDRGKKLNADVNDSERSRLRYQAAGEHIVRRCDLLLAIWDDDFVDTSPAGTGSIVEAKYAGPTSGILPDSSPLAWPDSGTIFHIHARRKKTGTAPNVERQGKIRIIHPQMPDRSANPFKEKVAVLWNAETFSSKGEGSFAQWMEEGNRHLARIVRLDGEVRSLANVRT